MLNTLRDLYAYDIITSKERANITACAISAKEIPDANTPYTTSIDEALDALREALYYDTIDDMVEDFDEVEHYSDEVIITISGTDITIELLMEEDYRDEDPNIDVEIDDMIYSRIHGF